MITLNELLHNQQYTNESDLDIIKKWFICNDMETAGIDLIAQLSASKANKLKQQLNTARTWIPIIQDMYESDGIKVSKDASRKLRRITNMFLLGMDLDERLLNWAKESVPNMNTPEVIFRPMVEWLKDKYNIEFADKKI